MSDNKLVDQIKDLSLEESTESKTKYIFGNALLRRAVNDMSLISEEDNQLLREEDIRYSIEKVLLTFLTSSPSSESKKLPHGLNLSLNLVTSVLCLKRTKRRALDHRRRSTRMIEKLLPWVINDEQIVVGNGILTDEKQGMEILSQVQQSSDALVEENYTTYSQFVHEFLTEYAPETLRSVILNENMFIHKETSPQSESVSFEFLLAPVFMREWKAYKQIKSNDQTASERSLKLLHVLLVCILTVLWTYYRGKIEQTLFWNYWYVFVVIAGAICVLLDAQYRRASASSHKQVTSEPKRIQSGILHILSEKFIAGGNSIDIRPNKFPIGKSFTVFIGAEQINKLSVLYEKANVTDDDSDPSRDLSDSKQTEEILHQAIKEADEMYSGISQHFLSNDDIENFQTSAENTGQYTVNIPPYGKINS